MSRTATNVLYNSVGQFGANAILFVSFIIFSRLLGPDRLGIFQIAYLTVTIVSILFVSFIDFSLVYHVGKTTDTREKAAFFWTSLAASFSMSAAVAAILWVGKSLLFFDILGIETVDRADTLGLFGFLLLFLLAHTILANVQAVFIAENRFRERSALLVLHRVAIAIGSVVCFLRWETLTSIGVGFFAGSLLSVTVAAVLLIRARFLRRTRISRSIFAAFVSYGRFTFLINAASQAHNWFDTFLISSFLATTQVGLYTVAYTLFSELARLPRIVGEAVFPRLLRQSGDDFNRTTRQTIRLLNLLQVPIGLVLIVSSEPLLRLLYGAADLDAHWVLAVLAVSLPFSSYWIANLALLALQRPQRMAQAIGISTGLNVLLNLLAIPRFGILGAAVVTTVTSLVYYALSVRYVRNAGVPTGDIRRTVILIGRTAVLYVLCAVGASLLPTGFGLFVGLAVFGALYLALIVPRSLTAEDRTTLAASFRHP